MRRLVQLWYKFRNRWPSRRELDPQLPLGQRGELLAARMLRAKGMRILEQGQRSTDGEIDIVALDGRTIVFVEVKTRASEDPLAPFEAVDLRKQRKLTSLALRYLKKHRLLEQRSRFDIVGINWPEHQSPHVRHVETAFEPTDRGQMFS